MAWGRIFRKLGLPLWTFAGIGIAAILFNTLGAIIERVLRDLLGINEQTQGFKTYVPPLVVLAIPIILVAIISIALKVRHQAPRMHNEGTALRIPEGKKVVIILVSRHESASFAIDFHLQQGTLEIVWLIPSGDETKEFFGESSFKIAQAIKEQYKDRRTSSGSRLKVRIERSVSPADSQDTFDCVRRIFRNSGYKADEIIADFTGGTKPMSVGMIMACLPRERELQYVSFNHQSFGPFLIDYQYPVFDLIG